ncbi:T9SS type A sorting domain-containing protein [Hymenobacter sp. BT178]|uniref:T9SS type A sorting domain-containing protein n=1 Tax=Hymenobacter lucidus TaxID=2880930 RepID=A0ABS8ART6_9BACT|nr:T9SS type A sorting domain-containing protein [Hymenobacter lucidus]
MLLAGLLSSTSSMGQAPTKQWDKTYGGNREDRPYVLRVTADGGSIIGGSSDSTPSGDKTENSINSDVWVLKLDAAGNKIWDRTVGTSSPDNFQTLCQASDGGYVLAANSNGNALGDKTQPSKGGLDMWIIKLDANGTKLWDKVYGGTSHDVVTKMVPTPDGGFLLCGYSESGISGDKTEATKGGMDFWVVRIDANGTKLWDKTYGGSGYEELRGAALTSDGGFVVCGGSVSGISGDKSQGTRGGVDFWVLKLDAAGTKQWDRTIGTGGDEQALDIKQTADGGYVMLGNTGAGISGDKTQPSKGAYDAWVVKIDASGNLLWDRSLGGLEEDGASSLLVASDGGILVYANSNSSTSGDKTQDSKGSYDLWLVKLASGGATQWDLTLGGSARDFATTGEGMQVTPDGGLLLTGQSYSPVSGDKTHPNRGDSDYWIMKLGSAITGTRPALADQKVGVYPNPAKNYILLHLADHTPRTGLRLALLDAQGRTVYRQPVATTTSTQVPIAVGQHPPGVYLLRLEGPDGYVATQRVVLE